MDKSASSMLVSKNIRQHRRRCYTRWRDTDSKLAGVHGKSDGTIARRPLSFGDLTLCLMMIMTMMTTVVIMMMMR